MIDEVMNDIPIEYRDRFHELLQQPERTRDELRRDVVAYITMVKQVGQMVKLLDLSMAEKLCDVALSLLDRLREDAPPPSLRLVQAAIQYLVLEEEDEEITGVLGFDDDVQVMNAVCRVVGQTALVIPLQR